jgi:hypothetical protein
MAQYDEDFDNAETPESGFREVPSGTYQAYVDRAVFDTPQWSHYPVLQLTCKITSGEYAGCAVFPSASCDPEYIHYLKGMLVKLGFEQPPRPSEIRGKLREMLDRVIEIYVAPKKEGKKYANCYVNRFVGMRDIEDNSAVDDGMPF